MKLTKIAAVAATVAAALFTVGTDSALAAGTPHADQRTTTVSTHVVAPGAAIAALDDSDRTPSSCFRGDWPWPC